MHIKMHTVTLSTIVLPAGSRGNHDDEWLVVCAPSQETPIDDFPPVSATETSPCNNMHIAKDA